MASSFPIGDQSGRAVVAACAASAAPAPPTTLRPRRAWITYSIAAVRSPSPARTAAPSRRLDSRRSGTGGYSCPTRGERVDVAAHGDAVAGAQRLEHHAQVVAVGGEPALALVARPSHLAHGFDMVEDGEHHLEPAGLELLARVV